MFYRIDGTIGDEFTLQEASCEVILWKEFSEYLDLAQYYQLWPCLGLRYSGCVEIWAANRRLA